MIVYNGKQVIIVSASNDRATVHYVESLDGRSETVAIEDLRADTLDELESALTETTVTDEEYEDTTSRWDAKVANEEAATATLWAE